MPVIAVPISIAIAGSACGGSSNPMPAGAQLGPALAAAMQAADTARTPWRCAAVDGPTLATESLAIGKTTWKLEGHVMSREGTGEIVIGAVADAGGAAPVTIAALGRLREKLDKADLVIALGGMGTTAPELEATLGAIADTAPIVALPGDLEDAGALATAVAALRAKGKLVIDGRLVHRIEVGTTTIGIVAGAGARGRLVADAEGCAYAPAGVAAILDALSTRKGVRVLASSEAPREQRGGEPTGELAVTVGELIAIDDGGRGGGSGASAGSDANDASSSGSDSGASGAGASGAGAASPDASGKADTTHEIDVALHGPMAEGASRARNGARDGNAVALTPGTADATPRLPDPARRPTVGLLVIRQDTWSWKPIADAP